MAKMIFDSLLLIQTPACLLPGRMNEGINRMDRDGQDNNRKHER
jgi:hypothetical protein